MQHTNVCQTLNRLYESYELSYSEKYLAQENINSFSFTEY